MTRFDKFLLVALSIALLAVSVVNAWINYEQNEMICRLKDRYELLEAKVDTRCDRLAIDLAAHKQDDVDIHNMIIESLGKMVNGMTRPIVSALKEES